MMNLNTLLQNLAMASHFLIILPGRFILLSFMVKCVIYGGITRYLVLGYILHFVCDFGGWNRGGRRCESFRKSWYFKLIAEYFPVKLVQKVDLPRGRNYLLPCHPHALLFMSTFLAFAVDVFNLEKRKGLRTFFTTLTFNFIFPLSKEYYLASGSISPSEESLKHVLEEEGGSNLVCLLVGGAEEASFSMKGEYKILVKKRRGFCRLALETGAPIVPTFVFGEVDCFDIIHFPENGFLKKCQQKLKDWTGVNILPYRGGSGLFGLPRRTPITIVMGEPLEVKKSENPSDEEIEILHARYVKSITDLFNNEKDKYLKDPNTQLIVV